MVIQRSSRISHQIRWMNWAANVATIAKDSVPQKATNRVCNIVYGFSVAPCRLTRADARRAVSGLLTFTIGTTQRTHAAAVVGYNCTTCKGQWVYYTGLQLRRPGAASPRTKRLLCLACFCVRCVICVRPEALSAGHVPRFALPLPWGASFG